MTTSLTPQTLGRKSNVWGVFVMMLTDEDTVEKDQLHHLGWTYPTLSQPFESTKSLTRLF